MAEDEENPPEETPQTPEEEAPETPQETPQKKESPPQIVEIRTPLDRAEFDWFMTAFMDKMHITDRKQAAIMASSMLYDMGLDPYGDLKDVQKAVEEMNTVLKSLPDTPTSARVKDTVGGMLAAKTGRTILEAMPRTSGQDPMMDRAERIMDKYMPMIMGMRMVTEAMRAEPGQTREKEAKTLELPDSVKQELGALRSEVGTLKDYLKQQQATERDKAIREETVKEIVAQFGPTVQALEAKITELQKQGSTSPQTITIPGLDDLSSKLREAIDKLGERAGAKSLTLAEVEPILTLMDSLEKRMKKEPTGEFDWKTAAISTIGEIGKEAVTAAKDVMAARTPPSTLATPTPTPQSAEMQGIIKRQVQNYILRRLNTGATTMNLQEAAQNLGLAVEQVAWAYQQLMQEGWINVRVPGQRKKKVREGEKETSTPERAAGEATEEETPEAEETPRNEEQPFAVTET